MRPHGLLGWHFLLQGIFPTQGLNPCLLLSRWILYHQGSLHLMVRPWINNILYRYLYMPWRGVALLSFKKIYIKLVSNIRESNGNPLQYSCLENPMDGGAWWAAVHGVAKSWHDWATSLSLFTCMHWRRKWQPTPVFLPGESQGQGSLVGCHLWGRTESNTTEVT